LRKHFPIYPSNSRKKKLAAKFNDQIKSKKLKMGNLLYIIAVILVIAWLIGFVGYHAGGLIHILLVIAIIAVLLRLIRGEKV
jgi:predicted ferric reductase